MREASCSPRSSPSDIPRLRTAIEIDIPKAIAIASWPGRLQIGNEQRVFVCRGRNSSSARGDAASANADPCASILVYLVHTPDITETLRNVCAKREKHDVIAYFFNIIHTHTKPRASARVAAAIRNYFPGYSFFLRRSKTIAQRRQGST